MKTNRRKDAMSSSLVCSVFYLGLNDSCESLKLGKAHSYQDERGMLFPTSVHKVVAFKSSVYGHQKFKIGMPMLCQS